MATFGFVAGTLVHTDKGLVPIEQIKVGDRVLSKHESGEGEQAYKRVLSTFKSVDSKKIYSISCIDKLPIKREIIPNAINEFETVYLTDNHPIWVHKLGSWAADILAEERGIASLDPDTVLGWQQAKNIRAGMHTFLADGRVGCVSGVNERIFNTDIDGLYYEQNGSVPSYVIDMRSSCLTRYFVEHYFDECSDVDYADRNSIYDDIAKAPDGSLSTSYAAVNEFMGYLDSDRRSVHEYGVIIDTSTPPNPTLVEFIDPEVVSDRNNLYENSRAKAIVYNIEVEDFHTYYVGELGLWVHALP
jgi:hypothetical protein